MGAQTMHLKPQQSGLGAASFMHKTDPHKNERRYTAPSGKVPGARRPLHAMSHALALRGARENAMNTSYAHDRGLSQQAAHILRPHGHYSNVAFKI